MLRTTQFVHKTCSRRNIDFLNDAPMDTPKYLLPNNAPMLVDTWMCRL